MPPIRLKAWAVHAAIQGGAVGYIILSLRTATFDALFLLTIALFAVAALHWLAAWRWTTRYADVAARTSLSMTAVLLTLVIVDALIFAGFLTLGREHDLAVLPDKRTFVTNDGYITSIHARHHEACAEIPGQISAYVGMVEDLTHVRRQCVVTDELGLRNALGSIGTQQDILLLGDSFAFGYGSDQDSIWSTLLERDLEGSVYNLGVYGASPSQQVELLRHLVDEGALVTADAPVFVLLVFEGNDFHQPNTYEYAQQNATTYAVKQSLKRWFSRGMLMSGRRVVELGGRGVYAADTTYQVLGSARFGPMAFRREYMERSIAASSDSSVAARRFGASGTPFALDRLQTKAKEAGARVVVLYQPTKSRVYGSYYPAHPVVPRHDHFESLVRHASTERGFYYQDLTPHYRAAAESDSLTFWRDDTHLSHEGHAVLARIVSGSLR